jgi:putative phosphoribosyl transferase
VADYDIWQRFADRVSAGQWLAETVARYAAEPDVIVLGLPRGGVPVARAVADGIGAPLDVFVVRKLGVPGHEELAFGAIASGGVRVLNDDVIRQVGLSAGQVDEITQREASQLEARERLYRGGQAAPGLAGDTVILVDDGLATGSTMRAAVQAVRAAGAARVVVAVPVAPAETCAELAAEADEVICLRQPEPFYAVGLWYEDFTPVSDDEVRQALDR